MVQSSIDQARAAWRAELGDGAVLDRPEAWRYGRGDHSDAPSPAGVVRARSVDDVVAAVRVASRFGIALHPISRGQNWGYGAATPVTAEQVVLDLGGMDAIVRVDDELGFAVVEPGVTQGALADRLAASHPRLLMDCTDAPAGTSVIGNLLERGIGFSAYGNRVERSCGLEVVLADGSVIETGYGGLGAPDLAHTRRWGVGPHIEGLFSQSNLGIVTKAGIMLAPRPEAMSSFWILVDGDRTLAQVVGVLAGLTQHAGLATVIHAGNWVGEQGWVCMGGLYGTGRYVAHLQGVLDEALAGIASQVHHLDLTDTTDQNGAAEVAAAFRAAIAGAAIPVVVLRDLIAKVHGVLGGRPVEGALFASGHLSLDSDADAPMRHLTATAVCNQRAGDIFDLIRLLRSTLAEHRIGAGQWCAITDPRTVCFVQHVIYRHGDGDEEGRALACYRALVERAAAAGHPPYRVANLGMGALAASGSWDVARRVKRALDPGGVLAPGKYIPQ